MKEIWVIESAFAQIMKKNSIFFQQLKYNIQKKLLMNTKKKIIIFYNINYNIFWQLKSAKIEKKNNL